MGVEERSLNAGSRADAARPWAGEWNRRIFAVSRVPLHDETGGVVTGPAPPTGVPFRLSSSRHHLAPTASSRGQERSVRGRLMCSSDDAGSPVALLSDSAGRRWTRLPKTRPRTVRFEHASLSSGRETMRPCSSRRYSWGSAFWGGPRRGAPRPTCSPRAFCLRWRPWAGTGRTWRGGNPPLIFRPDGRRAIRHHRGDVSRIRARVPRPEDTETPEHVPFRPRGPRTFEHGSTQAERTPPRPGTGAFEGPSEPRRFLFRTAPLLYARLR